MERTRQLAAAPVRSASDAWRILTSLISDTLERSSSVPAGSVLKELARLDGIGPALVAGGHLENKGLVLVDEDLHVTFQVLTGDAALDTEENLNPVPGGASSTGKWIIHIPATGPLDKVVAAAVKESKHLTMADAPESAPSAKSEGATPEIIDVNALRRLDKNR